MEKKKNINVIVFGIAVLVFAAIALFVLYQNRNINKELSAGVNEYPFAGIQVPDEFDEPTKNVLLQKIEKTKKMYNELPEAWETWIAIGNLRSLLKDYEGAIAAFKHSISLQSNNILGYRNIAETYKSGLHNYEKAAEYYKLAIDNNFSDPELYIQLALIQQNRFHDNKAAEETYLDGLEKTGNYPDIFVRLIRFYKNTGNQEKHDEYARRLLKMYPDNKLYSQEWGYLLQP